MTQNQERLTLPLSNDEIASIQVRLKTNTFKKRTVKTWTPEEDQLLFHLHDQYPKKWGKISELMKNRNENQCLHRFRRLSIVGEHKKIWSQEED